ncbi:ATP-dependent helicase, partial [Streptomyces sp. SID4944]|nr:ATP-dependent helicase [Streptomyces sp. SID4944]
MAAQGARAPGGGEPREADAGRLLRCAAVFLPGSVPRDGLFAFWDPHAEGPVGPSSFVYADTAHSDDRAPDGTVPYRPAEITVVRRETGPEGGPRPPGRPGSGASRCPPRCSP